MMSHTKEPITPTRRFVMVRGLARKGWRSMAELALAGEDHRDARLIGRGDHLLIAHRPAGLHDRADARFHRLLHAIAEWEVGVRAEHRTGRRVPHLLCLVHG